MTTQTQPDPKPEQLWRDLRPDEVPQAGDRYQNRGCEHWYTVGKDSEIDRFLDQWKAYVHSWQRPVTPGQCECAGLREALVDAEVRLGKLYYSVRNLTPKHFHETPLAKRIRTALANPHTCAGKSAEEGDISSLLRAYGWKEGSESVQMFLHRTKSADITRLQDQLDLNRDEFLRIKACPNADDEIKRFCDRSQERINQNVSVILQRDKAEKERDEARRKLASSKEEIRADVLLEIARDRTVTGTASKIERIAMERLDEAHADLEQARRKLAEAEQWQDRAEWVEKVNHDLDTEIQELRKQRDQSPTWRSYANLRAELWSKVYAENIKFMPESCADTAVAAFDKKFTNS